MLQQTLSDMIQQPESFRVPGKKNVSPKNYNGFFFINTKYDFNNKIYKS